MSEVRGMNFSPANVRLVAYNGFAFNVKGSIKFTNFLSIDKLLKNVKVLVVNKSCFNNLLGKV